MSSQTTNLGLYKPDLSDTVSATIPQLSSNFDKIDASLADIACDVKSKGAKGDGTTDDTSAIQNALSALQNGGVLLIPKGYTFLISSTLNISIPGIKVTGGGKLLKKSGANCKTFNISADRSVIDGIEIDGNRANQTIFDLTNDEIQLNNVKNCTIKNNYIHDSAGGGISLYNSSRNKVLNNRIENSHDNGIIVANLGSDYNLIDGNIIDGTTSQNNIFLTASSGSTATSDWIKGNIVVNNHCLNAGDTGIETGIHTIGTIINNNKTYNSVNPGILLRDCKKAIVTHNTVDTVTSANGDGIALIVQVDDTGCGENLIQGNNVLSPSRYGINIDMGKNNAIKDNMVDMNTIGANGIAISKGNNTQIFGNEVINLATSGDGSVFGAIQLEQCSATLVYIEGNKIQSSITNDNSTINELHLVNNVIVPKSGSVFNATLTIGSNTNVRAINNRWVAGRYATVSGTLATDSGNVVITATL